MPSEKLKQLQQQFKTDIEVVKSWPEALKVKNKYLGTDGVLKLLFKDLGAMTPQEKKSFGGQVNDLKKTIEAWVAKAYSDFSSQSIETPLDKFIKTLPGIKPPQGHLHIITQAIREIVEIFKPLGFGRVRHPEVDWDWFVFESLNMVKGHPARDEWETFFVKSPEHKQLGKMVITPHTSNGQVHEMLKGDLPIRMLNISRCGRRQSDINHIPTFYQFEGLVIDKNLSIADLKGTLDYFASNFFGSGRVTRLRPNHFNFTEPSFEVDINCALCLGKGCRFCKSGWVELGGAGMVHPNVLRAGKVDTKKYNGFAFGWGVERTYMMKSGVKIDDIRRLFENDLRFLEQF